MKSYRVEITALAKQDIIDIFNYIADMLAAPNSAVKQYMRLQEAILKLDSLPERGSIYKGISQKTKDLRFILVDNYVVYYHIDEERHTVYIYRVLYSRRNVNTIL